MAQWRGGSWAPHVLRSFNDGELKEAENILVRLNRLQINFLEDRVVRVRAKDVRFSVKRLYSAMVVDPSRVIWNSWVIPK